MKKFITILVVVLCGLWLFNHCSFCSHGRGDKDKEVLKQVRVAVKTANLRTGPGTNYDFVLDASGNKQQVSQGTVLNVVAEQKGWYEVRLDGDSTRIAYIKQSLCTDLNAKPSRKTNSRERPRNTAPASTPEGSPDTPTPSATQDSPGYHIPPATPPSSEEVVEEVTTGSTPDDDEIIY